MLFFQSPQLEKKSVNADLKVATVPWAAGLKD